jgi:hypothetical protein
MIGMEEDVRTTVAAQFTLVVAELEKIGIRRDLILDGMERAAKYLREEGARMQ